MNTPKLGEALDDGESHVVTDPDLTGEPCEPCSRHGDERPAVAAVGWDFTPVCEWHTTYSWSSRVPAS